MVATEHIKALSDCLISQQKINGQTGWLLIRNISDSWKLFAFLIYTDSVGIYFPWITSV